VLVVVLLLFLLLLLVLLVLLVLIALVGALVPAHRDLASGARDRESQRDRQARQPVCRPHPASVPCSPARVQIVVASASSGRRGRAHSVVCGAARSGSLTAHDEANAVDLARCVAGVLLPLFTGD